MGGVGIEGVPRGELLREGLGGNHRKRWAGLVSRAIPGGVTRAGVLGGGPPCEAAPLEPVRETKTGGPGRASGSPAGFHMRFGGRGNGHQRAWVSAVKPDQDFVRRVLQTGSGLVQLASRFTRQLAQLVAVGHMRECPKNQIRTHLKNLLPKSAARGYYLAPAMRPAAITRWAACKTTFHSLRRTKRVPSSKKSCSSLTCKEMGLCSFSEPKNRRGNPGVGSSRSGAKLHTPTHQTNVPLLQPDEGFCERTRDCAVQSTLVDSTLECITGRVTGQYIFRWILLTFSVCGTERENPLNPYFAWIKRAS